MTILTDMHGLSSIRSSQPILIVDDLDKLSNAAFDILAAILSDRSRGMKIIVVTRVLMDVKDLLSKMDVVVRFKQSTAEMLLTNLYDLER